MDNWDEAISIFYK